MSHRGGCRATKLAVILDWSKHAQRLSLPNILEPLTVLLGHMLGDLSLTARVSASFACSLTISCASASHADGLHSVARPLGVVGVRGTGSQLMFKL